VSPKNLSDLDRIRDSGDIQVMPSCPICIQIDGSLHLDHLNVGKGVKTLSKDVSLRHIQKDGKMGRRKKKKENDFRKRFGNTEQRRYEGVAGVETVCWILPALSRVLGKERPRKRLKNHDRRETFGVFFTQKKNDKKKCHSH